MLPSELTEQSLIPILLDSERRQQLVAALAQEQATKVPLANRYAEVAPRCQAREEELRAAVAILRRRKYRQARLLDYLLFHPQMPEDVLLDLAHQPRWVTPLGHRSGPRTLLEYLASTYRYSEAITTLALDYYTQESNDTFAAFIARYRTDYMLGWNVKRSAKLSNEQRALALALIEETTSQPNTPDA